MKEKLTFIYSRRVNRFLIDQCGLIPITEAINPNSGKTFNLYEKTPALQTGLNRYKVQQNSAN
jgi:hypothetical protein